NVSVIESSAVGTKIPLPAGSGPRRWWNNGTIVEYGIENDNDQFGLIYQNPGLLYLEVKQPLDRESSQMIALNVSAKDGGTPPRYGKISSNDLSSVQDTSEHNVSVIESSAVGTKIPLLPAVDPDAGNNGTIVEYGIENDNDQFGLIYQNPGLLYLEVKQPLDRESSQMIALNVSAKDGGTPTSTE
ncbi:cadherin domain protein, partial [Ostertagia ostertagi]